MPPISGENRLTKQQKTGFVLLLVFGILTVALGFFQMRSTIYSPFLAQAKKNEGRTIASFYDDTTRLQQIDTDQDGLNDYEELEFYKTSPYLPDTDSDGIGDKKEIDQGTDPLCPEGADCAVDASSLPPTTAEIKTLGNNVATPMDILTEASAGVSLPTSTATVDLEAILQDPKAIRQMLLNTGSITQAQLDAISDTDLLKMVGEIMTANK